MREILNISLPPGQKEEILKRAQKAGKNVSAYIMHAINLEKELIQENELIKMAKKAKSDYQKGKTKELKSLANLMN